MMTDIDDFTHIIEKEVTRPAGEQVFAEIPPHGARQTAVEIITDQFFELRTVH